MRILVTGSRKWSEPTLVYTMIEWAAGEATTTRPTIVVGDATGADTCAQVWAMQYDRPLEIHRADWNKHGKAAGPIRNKAMVDSGADICLAFFKQGEENRGTKNCVKLAQDAKIRVVGVWA